MANFKLSPEFHGMETPKYETVYNLRHKDLQIDSSESKSQDRKTLDQMIINSKN